MKRPSVTSASRRRQQGVAAVEFAVILPILILVLAIPLFLARFFWHYTVAQKAAHDAALYLSQVSRAQMGRLVASGEIPEATLAVQIAEMEIAELNPGGTIVQPFAMCESYVNASRTRWGPCNGTDIPLRVSVTVDMRVTDPFLTYFTDLIAGSGPLRILVETPMRYVGN